MGQHGRPLAARRQARQARMRRRPGRRGRRPSGRRGRGGGRRGRGGRRPAGGRRGRRRRKGGRRGGGSGGGAGHGAPCGGGDAQLGRVPPPPPPPPRARVRGERRERVCVGGRRRGGWGVVASCAEKFVLGVGSLFSHSHSRKSLPPWSTQLLRNNSLLQWLPRCAHPPPASPSPSHACTLHPLPYSSTGVCRGWQGARGATPRSGERHKLRKPKRARSGQFAPTTHSAAQPTAPLVRGRC